MTGTVSDAFGPVAGANVIQKGTTNGTTTDMDGNFSIEVPANATLQISFIGYIPQDIVVKNQNVINVLLKEDTQALEEVVVVGYGTMKKKDMTGAVSSVKMDDSPVATVSTVSHALAGKAAGLWLLYAVQHHFYAAVLFSGADHAFLCRGRRGMPR